MDGRPDLLIFVADQWRGDVLGHVGNPAALTPNLDRLVGHDAVSFTQTHCQSTICTPSRASLMSGRYPHVHGRRTIDFMLRPERGHPLLLATLKQHGYHVWCGGKIDMIPADSDFALVCDEWFRPARDSERVLGRPLRPQAPPSPTWRGTGPDDDRFYGFLAGLLDEDADGIYFDRDWAVIEAACAKIRTCDDSRPLCLYIALEFPHPPFRVERSWFEQIDAGRLPAQKPVPDWSQKPPILQQIFARQNLQGWSPARWQDLRRVYYGMCARVDHQLGLVLSVLEAAGRLDQTSLAFFADHGEYLGDYGLVEKNQNSFEPELTRVPLVIKPARRFRCQPGLRDALVELLDVQATVLEMAGIEPAYDHFGRSLLPLVAGVTTGHRDAVFTEGGRRPGELHASEANVLASMPEPRQSDYWPRLSAQALEGRDFCHGKAVAARTRDWRYVYRRYGPRHELYDLHADPAESRNLAGDPRYEDVERALKEQVLAWYVETCDVVAHEHDRRF